MLARRYDRSLMLFVETLGDVLLITVLYVSFVFHCEAKRSRDTDFG
jgi:hypothetical protein